MTCPYDAILVVSFGGPEGPDDVLPFLENVVRGKDVPRRRLVEVAARYERFGGVSPINGQVRALLAAVRDELARRGHAMPMYWGNRNWHPLLAEVLGQMARDGRRRALAFVTSAFSSYPGCRQYLEDILRARAEVGPGAPEVDKLRVFYNHPGFIEATAARLEDALAEVPVERRGAAQIVYTAHSLPLSMARTSAYERQLREACRLVGQQVGRPEGTLVYQSRSGPPSQPWLGPDVGDYLRELGQGNPGGDVVIVPIGFVCEHMETVYDLDVAARAACDESGLRMVRAATVGCHPRLVAMIGELIEERITPGTPRRALGADGPAADRCPANCCRPDGGRPDGRRPDGGQPG